MKIQSLVKLVPLPVLLALAGDVVAAELPDFTTLVERNAPAIGRPSRIAIENALRGELLLVVAISVHHENLERVVDLITMRDSLSIGRPGRENVSAEVVGMLNVANVLAVGVHQKQPKRPAAVTIRCECNRFAVGRPRYVGVKVRAVRKFGNDMNGGTPIAIGR